MKTPVAAADLLGLPPRNARSPRRTPLLLWILGALAFAFVIGFGQRTDPTVARVFLAFTAAATTLCVLLLGEALASLRGKRESSLAQQLPSHAALQEQKKQILTAIKELDFDRAMNKIDVGDFETLRARYERDALQVLKAIDEEFEGWRNAAETLAGKQAKPSQAAPTAPAAPAAAPEETRTESEARHCPSCKEPNAFDAVFCKKCGSRLPGPKVCDACQSENDADADFCNRCGTSLSADAAADAEPASGKMTEPNQEEGSS